MTGKTGVVGVPAEPTEQVLNALFEIANDIHGEIDKQTYDEKRAAEWDLPEDHAFDVRITQAQDHALNKAILLVEKHRAALAAPPSPLPAPSNQLSVNSGYLDPSSNSVIRKDEITDLIPAPAEPLIIDDDEPDAWLRGYRHGWNSALAALNTKRPAP